MKGQAATTEIAEPYAKALMAIAQEHDLVDRIDEDVAALREAIANSQELRQFLENPLVKPQAKKNVLNQLAEGEVHDYTLRFIRLLVDRGRILFLDAICAQYQTLLRQLKNIVLAEITAARELSDRQQDEIRDKVKAFTNANDVEIDVTIDPDLIGGFIVRVGSQVLDVSLRGQLRRLALSLS